MDRQERWDEFPVVFLTPDSDQWKPQATHYDDAAAAMIHNSVGIIGCESAIDNFNTADVSEMSLDRVRWTHLRIIQCHHFG